MSPPGRRCTAPAQPAQAPGDDIECFYYGFERFHPASVEGWRLGMLLVLRAEGLEIPPDWLGDAAADTAADGHAAYGGSAPAFTVFREQETRRLEELARALGGDARAVRSMRALRNPALKALWWLASRGHGINLPTSRHPPLPHVPRRPPGKQGGCGDSLAGPLFPCSF